MCKKYSNYKTRKIIFKSINKKRLQGRYTRFREIANNFGINDNNVKENKKLFNILRAKLEYYEDKGLIKKKCSKDDDIFDYLYNLTSRGVDLMPIGRNIFIWIISHIFIPIIIAVIINYISKQF